VTDATPPFGMNILFFMVVTGIDGCRSGWVAVILSAGAVSPRTATTLDGLDIQGVTGIDMPLGLLADGWRTADALARRALGGRGSSVFAIPPRPVWLAPDYATANRRCRELTGRGLSAQAWGLRTRLLEADRFRRGCARSLREVHPELSFAALAGAPLTDSKHSPAGLASRRALLEGAGIVLPRRVAGAAEHDLLDAAAVAWSARRVAAGTACVLPDPSAARTQLSDDGFEIAISY
jgi:predicted RNase H-like nuclease